MNKVCQAFSDSVIGYHRAHSQDRYWLLRILDFRVKGLPSGIMITFHCSIMAARQSCFIDVAMRKCPDSRHYTAPSNIENQYTEMVEVVSIAAEVEVIPSTYTQLQVG